MDIHQALAAKRVQLAKLQALIEMLEELANEVGTKRMRSGGRRTEGRRAPRSVSGKRAGRGANRTRVLNVLTDTPTRASEIARSTGLSQQSATQVLRALIEKGMVQQTGRGMYKATGAAGVGASSPSGDGESSAPRAGRTQKGAQGGHFGVLARKRSRASRKK